MQCRNHEHEKLRVWSYAKRFVLPVEWSRPEHGFKKSIRSMLRAASLGFGIWGCAAYAQD